MKILSIESSCDETAAAITEDGRKVISSVIATQIDEHKLYGGVVPEIASRRHCENITGVCAEALEKADMTLDEIDAIAVTNAPGLIGALLVGVNFAKGLALAKNKPLIAVHHIKGHIAANYITHPELEPPYLCLVVSGGHSHIVKVNSYTELETVRRPMMRQVRHSTKPQEQWAFSIRAECISTERQSRATQRSISCQDLRPKIRMISAFPDLKPLLSTLYTTTNKRALKLM